LKDHMKRRHGYRHWHVDLCLLWIFQTTFGVSSLQKKDTDDIRKLASAIYLQVSTISQALIFVTRSRSWSFMERPGLLLVAAFVIAQLVSAINTNFGMYSSWLLNIILFMQIIFDSQYGN
jgi:hypothetical protein